MTKTLKNKMVNRGYRSKRIQGIIDTVKFEQRNESLYKPKQTPENNTKPLVLGTRYSDCSKSICRILKKHWHLINSDATLKQVFPEPPMVAHKNNPSLANKLVRSKLKCTTHEPTMITRSQTRSNSQGRLNSYTEQTTNIQTRNLFHNRKISRPCGERNCLLCARLTDTCFILSKTHKRRHYIRYVGPTITCTTERVVYLIRCKNAINNMWDKPEDN